MNSNLAHVDPPPNRLFREMSTGNSDGDCVKLNLRRDPTSRTSDLYEFRMSLVDHGEPEEFLLFVQKFQTTLAASGNIEMEAKVKYLCTLVHGEVLRQFDLVSADVKNTGTQSYVDYLLKGLAWYPPP